MKFIFVLLFVSFAFSEEISLFKAIKLLRDKNAVLLQNPTLSVNYTGLNFGKSILYDTGNTLFTESFLPCIS